MFIINTINGRYKIQMRGAYQKSIRSEKKLLQVIQNSINNKKDRGTHPKVIAGLQECLDAHDIFKITQQWGIINWRCRVDENGEEIK